MASPEIDNDESGETRDSPTLPLFSGRSAMGRCNSRIGLVPMPLIFFNFLSSFSIQKSF